MKRILVCADDYGLSASISEGILALLDAGRLDAVSAMPLGSAWPVWGPRLRAHPRVVSGSVSVGWHINLTAETEGTPEQPLWQWMVRAHIGCIPRNEVWQRFKAQWHAFCGVMGKPPDFWDGHQHVHHLPGIRSMVLDFYAEHCPLRTVPIRVSWQRHRPGLKGWSLKGWIIARTGARALSQICARRGIPTYPSFGGIYPFKQYRHYRMYAQRFLEEAADGGCIMCHPGLPDGQAALPMAVSRVAEWVYWMSPESLEDRVRFTGSLQ